MDENQCRVCLSSTQDDYSITKIVGGVPLWAFLSELGKVDIRNGDGFPQKVCFDCFETITHCVELRTRIEESDRKLRWEPLIKIEVVDIKVELEEGVEGDLKVASPKSASDIPTDLEKEMMPDRLQKKKRVKHKKFVPTKCCMCGASFQKEAQLSDHCREAHPEGAANPDLKVAPTTRHKYSCKFCHRVFYMKRHVREHFSDPSYREPKRDRSKEKPSKNYNRYRKGTYVCSICGLQLSEKTSLELHEASKHSVRNIVCDFEGCNRVFGHKRAMTKHKQYCHSEKKYTCDLCGKCYSFYNLIRRHMFVHMENKPYQCDICPRSFSHVHVLSAHKLAAHSSIEKAHPCDLCEKAYKWKEDLRAHRMTHFGQFPFVCKHCGKGYTSASSKKYHEQRCPIQQPLAMPPVPDFGGLESKNQFLFY